MFYSILISMAFCLRSNPGTWQCGLEVLSAIYETYDAFDIMLLPQFFK
jgi:hypothetical protein